MSTRTARALGAIIVSLTFLAPAAAETVTIACSAVGQELELCRTAAEAWAQETGNEVEVVSTPNSATERLALYQQLLAAGADDIDVFQIDVIWPGILGEHFIDLRGPAGDAVAGHFPVLIENNTVNDRLVAMPWFVDAGLLYYRKDLLERNDMRPPQTWTELSAAAARIQDAERSAGNDQFWGFVWQGRAYEGLTCNALEWLVAYNGGTIIDAGGAITVNNPGAALALEQAASWVDTVSPPGVLNYAEEDARGIFQSGNAAFMRNWPYAWALLQSEDSPVRDKVGVAALPAGTMEGRHAATLGGQQLAVSRYSRNPELAAGLVLYLTGAEEQKRRALLGSFNPTIVALYEDPEVLEANPFYGTLYDIFVHAVPRPAAVTGEYYNEVSSEFWNAVHAVLSGRMDAATALAALEGSLMRLNRGGRRW